MQRFGSALILAVLIATPASAGSDQPQRCSLFCKLWRNVSGRVQTPVSTAAWDDGGMREPTLEEEARSPRPSDVVAVHGEVIRKTGAQRRDEQAALAEEAKRIDALRDGGAETAQAAGKPRHARIGDAD